MVSADIRVCVRFLCGRGPFGLCLIKRIGCHLSDQGRSAARWKRLQGRCRPRGTEGATKEKYSPTPRLALGSIDPVLPPEADFFFYSGFGVVRMDELNTPRDHARDVRIYGFTQNSAACTVVDAAYLS